MSLVMFVLIFDSINLQVLTSGYQTRGTSMIKQINELYEKIEASQIENHTFQELLRTESGAIPHRMEVISYRSPPWRDTYCFYSGSGICRLTQPEY